MSNLAVNITSEFASHCIRFGFTPSLYELVLRDGEALSVGRLSVAEARYVCRAVSRHGGVNSYDKNMCYYNSASVFLYEDVERRLEYWEGYFAFLGCPLPIPHAWLVLNGKIVDLTARAVSKHRPSDYLGVNIPRSIVQKHIAKTQMWGPVLEGPFARRLFTL